MGKIPSHLTHPDNPESLDDDVLFEWMEEGKHDLAIQDWAAVGQRGEDSLTERESYLVEVIGACLLNDSSIHEVVRGWYRSVLAWQSLSLRLIRATN